VFAGFVEGRSREGVINKDYNDKLRLSISKAEEEEEEEEDMFSVAVCMFGVVGRSIRKTWPSMIKHIFLPLKNKKIRHGANNITLYIFNLDLRGATIDGVAIDSLLSNFSDLWGEQKGIINQVVTEEMAQEVVDFHTLERCRARLHSCKLRYNDENLPQLTVNAFRQMYAENKVAHFLRKHSNEFDLVVATGPDFFFTRDIPLVLDTSIVNKDENSMIYIPRLNEGEGFTNGFYVGQPLTVAKAMSRYDEYVYYANLERDYERILKAAVDRHNITRVDIDMPFCKVRANGDVWAGVSFPKEDMEKCTSLKV
jgi:hypothetical protein